MTEWWVYVLGAGAVAFVLLYARGLWILKKSGDARIEQKRAEIADREGRDGDRQLIYEQKKEREALAKIRNNRLTAWILRGVGIK